MRIALYARVSAKDKGQDHGNQLRELRDFVERKAAEGWTLHHEYVDRASGKTPDRPAFRRLFDAASRKEFDLVLFWSLDFPVRTSWKRSRTSSACLSSYTVPGGVPALHGCVQGGRAGHPGSGREEGAHPYL